MHRLETVIEQYGRWSDLRILTDRIKAHLDSDFSHCIENSVSLLVTISKEICKLQDDEITEDLSVNATLKRAFKCLGHSGGAQVTQISISLASIGQRLGELRNQDGLTAHGRTLDQIKLRNDKYSELTKDFLMDSTVSTAIFLIRAYETENPRTEYKPDDPPEKEGEDLAYLECEEFNSDWDDSFGEFSMADYSYTASEVLFNVDIEAYSTEYRAYLERAE